MTLRSIEKVVTGFSTTVGPLKIIQPLPTEAAPYLDPFILLHHAGPQTFSSGDEHHRIDPHPHSGFDPVTFLFEGKLRHKDSLGSEGWISDGEVQWISSGSGIVHSEGITADIAHTAGTVELVQLWINVPIELKSLAPDYQELHRSDIPNVQISDGLSFSVVCGNLFNTTGPGRSRSEIHAAMGTATAGATSLIELPPVDTALLYILGGRFTINDGTTVNARELVIFSKQGKGFQITCLKPGRLLLLAGQALGEPMHQYGPFVAESESALETAIVRYRAGEFGMLDE